MPRQDTRVDVEAVPRRVRRLLHAPQRGSGRSARKPGRPTRRGRKRSARAPRSWPPRREWERARQRDPAAAGRMEERRAGAPHQVRGDVAAVPGRVRHVLRSLQAARRDRARDAGRRIAKRSSRSSNRWCRPAAAEAPELQRREIAGDIAPPAPDPVENAALLEQVRSLRSRWNQSTTAVRQGADPLSGRFMSALERLMAAYPEAFRGTELDVDANRQKMEKLCAARGGLPRPSRGPARRLVAGARGDAPRGAGLQHDRRPRRRGIEVARRWRRTCAARRPSWSRLGPVPGRGRTAARRSLPPRLQPVLRSVSAGTCRSRSRWRAAGKPVGAR